MNIKTRLLGLCALVVSLNAAPAMGVAILSSDFDLQGSSAGQNRVTPDDTVSFTVDARGYSDVSLSLDFQGVNTENGDRFFIYADGVALHNNGGIRLGSTFDLTSFIVDLASLDNMVFELVFQIATNKNNESLQVRDMVVRGNRLTTVAEPTSLAIMGLGLLVLGVSRRRRG